MEHIIVTTKEQLSELLSDIVHNEVMQIKSTGEQDNKKESHLIFGIRGLANFLVCSTATAQKYKNEKLFPCIQQGRKVIFKSDEVLAGLERKRKSNR
jgi:hypothetical protein